MTPYIGQIIQVGYMRGAPEGWLACDGSLQQISDYEALFQLIGTTYGGDGNTTFGLPDMRGRVSIHQGSGYAMGSTGGETDHSLTANEMPSHVHIPMCNTGGGTTASPANAMPAVSANSDMYAEDADGSNLSNQAVLTVGAGASHVNMQPYQVNLFAIATQGIYPSQDGSLAVEVFMGTIMQVAFSLVPGGCAPCNGQMMAVNQNQALFSLLGVTYGGNGSTTFGLPNLQGRVMIGQSSNYPMGCQGGEAAHTLTQMEMPNHTHLVNASGSSGESNNPNGTLPGVATAGDAYATSISGMMSPKSVSSVGSSMPHNNMQPYLTTNFIIALQGLYPARS